MKLPPQFLDDLRDRITLSAIVGRRVIWDARKSNPGRGDFWAPCPFHHEKTPSFHVDDRKGFYYCFGCQEKGDAIGFVMATDNVSFIDAVRLLADEAGMPLPDMDPHAARAEAERTDRRTTLTQVMEQAARYYRLMLAGSAGADARAYLAGRGLDDAAQARWGLGYAPGGWQGLGDHMAARGVAPDLLIAAGLSRSKDPARPPYDVFRDRIMFPIRDARDHCIAFGGRAMAADEPAKYLNSPETELFDKGRTLYNIGPAMQAARKGAPLIVAEGYMDVIALAEAGFAASVAPLGTAITEHQLRAMWRAHAEPVLALDGDRAGQAAALRAVHLALPLLEAGQSLRFCLLPQGQDPDDLLRAGGAPAMLALLDAAQPAIALLWREATAGQTFDSPERRATLDRALAQTVARIADPGIRTHYLSGLKDLKWQLFRPAPKARRDWKTPVAIRATAEAMGAARGTDDDTLREAVVLALLLRYPHLLAAHEAALDDVTFADAGHAALARAMRRHAGRDREALRTAVAAEVGAGPLEKLAAHRHLPLVPALRRDDAADAALCLAQELAKLTARGHLPREIDDAIDDLSRREDEALTWRLSQARAAIDRADRSQSSDRTEYDVAANGARISRAERDTLDGLLARIGGRNKATGPD